MSTTDEEQLLQELRNDLGVEINAFKVEGIKFPVALRMGTIDGWIFNNIFNHKEYEMPLVDFRPRFIIDCGANIGCSAVYFANEYPAAKIIAVEPEDTNFRMLTYNAHFYNNIVCRHAAIWNKATYIKVVPNNNTTDCMTVETRANDPQAIESTTILKLLNESGADEIDLLKIDIEGAEKELFSDDNVQKWLPRVNVIAIELHDRVKRGCSSAMFRALARYDFYLALNGENLIFIREDCLN